MYLFAWSFFSLIFFNVYVLFWGTETECEQGKGREREGDTKFKAGSRLWAVNTEPDAGLEFMDREIMTWVKVGHLTDWATQVPQYVLYY